MNYQGEFTTWKSMCPTPTCRCAPLRRIDVGHTDSIAIFGINNQKKRKEDYRDWVIKEHK